MASPTRFVISKQGDAKCTAAHDALAALEVAPTATVLACILVLKDPEPFLAIFKKLADDSTRQERVSETTIPKVEVPSGHDEVWLQHKDAAQYLGIAKDTLYRYAEQGHIESRKLGNRLEYRRSLLDKFKDQHVRPARRSPRGRGIIVPALSSGN